MFQDRSLALAIPSIALPIFAYITVGLRCYVRTTNGCFGLDDWLMVLGLVLYTAACISTALGSFHGIGVHTKNVSADDLIKGQMFIIFLELFYIAASVPIKSSICVSLLRIAIQRRYKYPLYGIIAISFIAAVITLAIFFSGCTPFAATWDPSLGHCRPPTHNTDAGYFFSAVTILTDWMTGVIPAFLLWNVRMKIKVKVSLITVLALGALASTATIVRLQYLVALSSKSDYLYMMLDVCLWSIVEAGIGIAAGSIATLRPLLRRVFGSSSGSTPGRSLSVFKSYRLRTVSVGDAGRSAPVALPSEQEDGSNDDIESQRGILKDGLTNANAIHITEDVRVEREDVYRHTRA